MDLSFAKFEHDARAATPQPDLGMLLVGVAARQASSPTALAQARIDRPAPTKTDRPFTPPHGAFSNSVAGLLAGTASAAWSKP